MRNTFFLSRLQSAVLSVLVLSMLLPYASAQVSPLPSTTPDTAQLQSEAERQASLEQRRIQTEAQTTANNAMRATLDSQNVPMTLRQSLEGSTPQRTRDASRSAGYTAVQEHLAASDLPAVDPVAVLNDASPLIDAGVTDPARIGRILSSLSTAYNNASTETNLAQLQSYWAAGVQGSSNCAADDAGKDLCTAIVELKEVLDGIDSDLTSIVSNAKTLRTFVSGKPAFMPTASLPPRVCTGLAVPGPGVSLTDVAIAPTDPAYDPSTGRLSFADALNQLRSAGNISQSSAQLGGNSGSSLGYSTGVLRTNSQTYGENVAHLQERYDHLEALVWQRFDTTLHARFTTFKKHTEELEQFSEQLSSILSALNLHPRTP
jgi:hypothetical protein